MRRRSFLAGAAAGPAFLQGASLERPNIVFILFDKCRRDAIGAYGMKQVSTPNLDWLAQTGVRFSNAYTPQALCGPARASIITGKYPHAHRLRRNAHTIPRTGTSSYHEPLFDPFRDPRFDLWDNFPYFLHNAGYVTGHIGKWHLGPGNPGFFDTWRSFNSQMFHWVGEPHHSPYRPDVQTDFGIEFIERNAGRPFFLYLSYYPPHEPYDPPKRFVEAYRGRNLEPLGYYAAVANLDWNVGRLLDALRKRQILDRTFTVVTTEHGMTSKHRPRPGTGEGGYNTPYDDVSRIPLILRYRPGAPAGVVWRSGASLVDLMPTILDAAGVAGRLGESYRERSLLPDLRARRDRWRGPVILQNVSQQLYAGSYFEDRAIRTEKWKLILRKFQNASPGAAAELYDMEADPEETRNLYGERRPVAGELALALARWGEEAEDPLSAELGRRG